MSKELRFLGSHDRSHPGPIPARLLAVHPLRAADAFQLAAALQWCGGRTKDVGFVSFDARLREAGYREGFTLLPAE